MQDTAVVNLEGTVERVTFFNPENGFTVLRLRVRGKRDLVAVVGTLPAVQPGELLVLAGRWQIEPRHGTQFVPVSAEISRPSDVDGIIRYLGSGMIRQIGPILARRIVAVFGSDTLAILDGSPERVREVPGIGRQRAIAIAAAWREHCALRGIVSFLADNQLNPRFAPRLLRAFGPDAPRILAANPYRLVAEVPGLGFGAADTLGAAIGVRQTSPARLQAAVLAVLIAASEHGDTRLPRPDLIAAAARTAGVDPGLIDAAIRQQAASGAITYGDADESGRTSLEPDQTSGSAITRQDLPVDASGRVRVYESLSPYAAETAAATVGLSGLVRAENDLGVRIAALARRPGVPIERVDAALAGADLGQVLSEEQYRAVRLAASSALFILTGGPGVGKTTTVKSLARLLVSLGKTVALAAPTGKAAKRLGDVVGIEACTLHRLLGAGPSGFRHGPDNPLPFAAIIVDECSMLDTALARALVRACGPHAQLILVGDSDQLPSVGPGQVLRDLLTVIAIPAVRLVDIFRQSAASKIVTNAHRIRSGMLPELALPTEFGDGVDCLFVRAGPSQLASLGATWASDFLPRLLGVTPAEVQTLAPLTRVCQTLNAALQARLNPLHGRDERPHGALGLRAGDRVIQTRNNYDIAVFNGDTGTIVSMAAEAMVIDFGDERRVEYSADDLLELDHAYCLTVHRAQGSEWPGVVILLSSSFGPIVTRNLLYTALTRARKAVVIIGDDAAIERAVANTRDMARRTGLADLLARSID
jgi:exodeoxyribonuclease V alpha subunit